MKKGKYHHCIYLNELEQNDFWKHPVVYYLYKKKKIHRAAIGGFTLQHTFHTGFDFKPQLLPRGFEH